MAHAQIISGIEFNPESDVTFTKAKINANGRKQIGILNTKNKKGVYLSTPLMLTWGINEYTDDKTGSRSYDMALQFPNDEYNNPECVAFLKNMQILEQRIKTDAIINCKDWLNKTKTSPDAIDALWTPMLRYPKDKETGDFDYSRPPTLKVKLNYWEGEYKNTEIYDDNQIQLFPNENETFPIDLITKGAHVATILSCGGIWVANGKFGVTWRLFQAVVKPRLSLAGKCHINLSTKDKQILSETAEKQLDLVTEDEDENIVSHLASTTVADSDDEMTTINTSLSEEVTDAIKEEVKAVTTEETPKKKRVVKKGKSTEA
tara:strand:+ start:275 stop:1228 length:954 start_codon:yes stop_codon:yes gene_type:complete